MIQNTPCNVIGSGSELAGSQDSAYCLVGSFSLGFYQNFVLVALLISSIHQISSGFACPAVALPSALLVHHVMSLP